MLFFQGIGLLAIGMVVTLIVFSIIFYVEMPTKDKNKTSDNPIINFWRSLK